MERSRAQSVRIAENPAAFLTAVIQAYIATSINNQMPAYPGEDIWDAPLVGFADGDDLLFHDYRRVIGDFHVTPREALEMRIQASGCGPPRPATVSVISFVLPSTSATRRSQHPKTAICSLR